MFVSNLSHKQREKKYVIGTVTPNIKKQVLHHLSKGKSHLFAVLKIVSDEGKIIIEKYFDDRKVH